MSRRVLKWTIAVNDQDHAIGGGPVVHAACQHGDPSLVQVWTVESEGTTGRDVRVFATGQPLPDAATYLATTLASDGALVWHVFDTTAVSS
jgi:hypothetical protein